MSEQTDSPDKAGAQAPASGGPGAASAGVPSGAAPSGAVQAGQEPEDGRDDVVPAERGPEPGGEGARAVPGTPPGPGVTPVPSPGAAPGVSVPGVQAAQAASPDDGISGGEKTPGSDSSVSSPGAWTSTAVPGKPDGEVDTRAR